MPPINRFFVTLTVFCGLLVFAAALHSPLSAATPAATAVDPCPPLVDMTVAPSVTAAIATGTAANDQHLPPGPQVVYQSILTNVGISTGFDVYHFILDLPPGTGTPLHLHDGPVNVIVLEGEPVFCTSKMRQTYKPGESWIENPHEPGLAFNPGSGNVRLSAVVILPKGGKLSTVVGQ